MREIEKIIAKSRPIPQKRHGNSTVDKCIQKPTPSKERFKWVCSAEKVQKKNE